MDSPTTPACTSARCFSTAAQGQIVTVKLDLGPQILEYNVHKTIICQFSAYFERAFKDSTSLHINAEISIFNLFINWLYTNRLHSSGLLSKDLLLKAIAFGHDFTAPSFQASVHNELVDLMIATRSVPKDEEIIFAFDNLPADHVLLDFFTELHALWGARDAKQLRMQGNLPEAFCARVEEIGFKFVDLAVGEALVACEFHIHATDEERWECEGA